MPSAHVVFSQAESTTENYQVSSFTEYGPHELTTPRFDKEFVGKVSTLVTDETFSWIVTQPTSRTGATGYFVREILTQLLVGLLLSALMLLIQPSSGLAGAGLAALMALVAAMDSSTIGGA